jgi:glycosyltransferase involved in cell wall biosynthesis
VIDNVTGHLIERKVDAIAERLLDLDANREKLARMQIAALEYSKRLSNQHTAKAYEELYCEVLADHPELDGSHPVSR